MTIADPKSAFVSSPQTRSVIPGPPVAMAAIVLLRQCEEFVGRVSGSLGAYTQESRTIKGGSIGKHVRHTLDHFRAALEAHARSEPICYDRRERNVPMETDPGAARAAIEELCVALSALAGGSAASPVRVRVMIAGDGTEAELDSSLGRELAFASHHAVHHHAMMGAIAREFGLGVPEGFGLAPSTLNHVRCLPHE